MTNILQREVHASGSSCLCLPDQTLILATIRSEAVDRRYVSVLKPTNKITVNVL